MRQLGCNQNVHDAPSQSEQNDPQRPSALQRHLRSRQELRERDAWRATAKRLTTLMLPRLAPAFRLDAGAIRFRQRNGAPADRNIPSANGGLMRKYYLLVSDFDQTLSFNDSGLVLAEMLGIPDFQERVANLSRLNLVQSGAELTYLLRHDPDFRAVREEHLIEVGRRIRLKRNIALLAEVLKDGIDGFRFDFYVVSAAPWLVVNSALNGIVPPDHVNGAHFEFNQQTGEIDNVIQVPAGYGKVAAVDSLRW